MPNWLKQSTSVDVGIGPFLDETDGKTAETGLTITQPDIRLKKNGGAWAQKNAAQTLSHEEAGWYEVTLDATDTNTLGILIVAVHESGALPVWKEYMVVPAMIYDSIVAGSDRLDTNVTHVGDTAQTAGDIIADTNDIQTRLPAALVSGRIDASVGAMAHHGAAKRAGDGCGAGCCGQLRGYRNYRHQDGGGCHPVEDRQPALGPCRRFGGCGADCCGGCEGGHDR
jgi:hypothetical protein